MAKTAAKDLDVTINSVVYEDEIDSFSLNVDQETPVVTCFSDAGPRRVAGNYDWGMEMAGKLDTAAGQSDASLYALIGTAPFTAVVEPTGAATPNYTGTAGALLSGYKLNFAVGGAAEFSASFAGAAALVRNA